MKLNFLTILRLTCTRVSSFSFLRILTLRRIFLYQLFLALLLALFSTLVIKNRLYSMIDKESQAFINTFEGIKIENNSLKFIKNNDKVAESISGVFKFNYYPNIKELDSSWSKNDELKKGVIFLPECVTFWVYDREQSNYYLVPIVYRNLPKIKEQKNNSFTFKTVEKANQFIGTLAAQKGSLKAPTLAVGQFSDGAEESIEKIVEALKKSALMILFIASLLSLVGYSCFLALLFSSFTALWSKNTVAEWKFVEALKVNLLVSFPAMIIACLYSVTGVQIVGFTFVLLLCFVIYNFVVFRYLTNEKINNIDQK
ncbi:hypothetical protein AAEX28_10280 [Lentisphaerota bacterium WC36G]|nr:hypothetical protein LJT99_13120 [Lentisphaerae bacterium WC36]